jgi:hypothetical protein
MVDSGFVVDLGVYSAPNQPNSPDQPRSLLGRVQHVPLLHHSTRSSRSESRTLPIRRTASAAYPAGSRRAQPGPGVPGRIPAYPARSRPNRPDPGPTGVPFSAAVGTQPQSRLDPRPHQPARHVTQLIFYKNDRLSIFLLMRFSELFQARRHVDYKRVCSAVCP